MSKAETDNVFDSKEKRDLYIALRARYLAGSADGSKVFDKYFARVDKCASYYARGGLEYLRDRDVAGLRFSNLRLVPAMTHFTDFEDLSQKAHTLNWILIRGKHYKIPLK